MKPFEIRPGAVQPSPVDVSEVPEGPVEQTAVDALDATQLWRAVHVGDESIVKAFVSRPGIGIVSQCALGRLATVGSGMPLR